MELIIKTPESAFPSLIEFNYEELKSGLASSLEKYQGLAYNDDSIKEAKADRATLNKLKAAIEDARKNQKKVCLAPYEEFERKIKVLVGMIDKPMLEIDSQVKNFEEKQKADRKKAYQDFYTLEGADIIALVPFDKIFDDKWLNSSTSKKAVEDVIRKTVARIKVELETVDSMGGDMALQCKDVYLRTLNLSDALNEKKRLEELQERLEAEKRRKEAEAPAAKEEAPQAETVIPDPVYQPVQTPQQETVERRYSLSFRIVDATAEQLKALRAFLSDNEISFERIEV